MPRHNYIVQRSCKRAPEGNATWLDTFTSNHPSNRGYLQEPMLGRGRGVADKFRNDGFASIDEARKELEYFRKNFSHEAEYRIVQVIS